MRNLLLLFFYLLLQYNSIAQTGNMIVIKKGEQRVKTFMKGLTATFRTTTGDWVNATIHDLKNDSIFFKDIIVRQVATQWGVPRMDTMATIIRGMHYQDIAAVPKRRESFSFIRNGTLFMIGGAGYVGLNVINSAILKYPVFDKENLPGLAAGAGIFGVGKLMQKLHKDIITVGKKYTIHYIKLK
jgi:hypothetical protein